MEVRIKTGKKRRIEGREEEERLSNTSSSRTSIGNSHFRVLFSVMKEQERCSEGRGRHRGPSMSPEKRNTVGGEINFLVCLSYE